MSKKKLVTKDVRKTLSNYISLGIFSKSLTSNIVKYNDDELNNALCENFYNLSKDNIDKIWLHLMHNFIDKDNKSNTLTKYELVFIKCLLENKGILQNHDVKNMNVIKTHDKMKETAINLQNKDIIDVHRINNKLFYLLNGIFFNKIINGK